MIGPVIALILGLAYLFLAPKEANYYFGYRCYSAWQRPRMAVHPANRRDDPRRLGLILTVIMAIITAGYGSMDRWMVWSAVNCLVWEAVLLLIGTIAINLIAMANFDAKASTDTKRESRKIPRGMQNKHNIRLSCGSRMLFCRLRAANSAGLPDTLILFPD